MTDMSQEFAQQFPDYARKMAEIEAAQHRFAHLLEHCRQPGSQPSAEARCAIKDAIHGALAY
ncbi:MAG: hypothetical protein AAFZ99_18580 [Pseudomonadota bacterium]